MLLNDDQMMLMMIKKNDDNLVIIFSDDDIKFLQAKKYFLSGVDQETGSGRALSSEGISKHISHQETEFRIFCFGLSVLG